MEDSGMPGTIEAFARASRHGRFGGDEEEEEEVDDVVGSNFFRKQAIPAGMEMEMALMREERERDKELKEKNYSSTSGNRRVWENHEIGVGYQHKTVMRQAVAHHDKVVITDMSKEKKKRKKKSAEEKEAEKEKEREAQAAAETEALRQLRALIWRQLRQRGRLEKREGGKEREGDRRKEDEEEMRSASSPSRSKEEEEEKEEEEVEEEGRKMDGGRDQSRLNLAVRGPGCVTSAASSASIACSLRPHSPPQDQSPSEPDVEGVWVDATSNAKAWLDSGNSLPFPVAVSPETVGMSSAHLGEADNRIEALVQQKKIAGASFSVMRNGQIVTMQTHGYSNVETEQPILADTIFRIFSQSKPINTAAFLTLIDDGLVEYTDPVSLYIPEFANLKPLGMKDTGFYVPLWKAHKLATVYERNATTNTIHRPKPDPHNIQLVDYTKRPAYLAGGSGLVSSMTDMMKFGQMLLNKGKHALSPSLPPSLPPSLLPFIPRCGRSAVDARSNMVLAYGVPRLGEFSWGGGMSTNFWVSPQDKTVIVTMVQIMPYTQDLKFAAREWTYRSIDAFDMKQQARTAKPFVVASVDAASGSAAVIKEGGKEVEGKKRGLRSSSSKA
ncbi:beta-lactamase [Nannochloropsis oceanica]